MVDAYTNKNSTRCVTHAVDMYLSQSVVHPLANPTRVVTRCASLCLMNIHAVKEYLSHSSQQTAPVRPVSESPPQKHVSGLFGKQWYLTWFLEYDDLALIHLHSVVGICLTASHLLYFSAQLTIWCKLVHWLLRFCAAGEGQWGKHPSRPDLSN